ncbi:Phenylalanine-4-hydroxylase [Kordia antarctica]|uniref:Phenylalanine-4-hydroxylase n=1 Tax=Kordia antarctica TaxID=1218801 RepID=A0A7L4ZJL1_9FLAO|nr:aromatic amino acid hydroxylase [Kordia antarctica]QHI36812.1 Phenylalanine-4-hydroxylase [Kordia antarctica]
MNQNIETNPLLDRLPPHLQQYIKPQNYDDYSAINQAVWRYVMRKSVSFLSTVAHDSYLSGLQKTGISIDEIPSMYGMNRILKEIGWAAVAVDGFIPPNAFMEFQAYKVLVIASDIRQLENITYTPAPDIIHEAAGHAPIISNPDYAEYLRRFGEIGAKAILSAHDNEMYEAVRKLSIVKESLGSTETEIESAETRVNELQSKKVALSEMAMIRNLHWWTVEYGLIGDIQNPKIYGAGLLSSIGESKWCMTDKVKKIPYALDAAYQEFDITKPQPQLYVTPDFSHLMQVLEEFVTTMALRKGGFRGLQKLINSKKIGTIELSTGLQVSGIFTEMITNEDNEVVFFKTEGPTALSNREKELIGHGITMHPHGFSSPLGKLKGINLAIEDMSPRDLKAYNFYDGERIAFEYESGIKVEGLNVTGIRNINGKLILIQFTDCTVTYKNEVLFKPAYGTFDLALGKEIVSAYAGAADYRSFDMAHFKSETLTVKIPTSKAAKDLEALYAKVRDFRTKKDTTVSLETIFEEVSKAHSNDWLLLVELYELATEDISFQTKVLNRLEEIQTERPEVSQLIADGIELVV